MSNDTIESVWVFHGEKGRFASGVFTTLDLARKWILENKATGMLTLYPLNEGVYQWAIRKNIFEVKKDSQTSPQFIQSFTTAAQEHYHYEDGLEIN